MKSDEQVGKNHIYGPVNSRRLGLSLGVDLVPFKTCDYDCVYCQLGRTTVKTTARKPYVPAEPVLDELRRVLDAIDKPDCITLAGSGEPTLNSELDAVAAGIKEITDIPLVVLTNGSLLGDPLVAEACLKADLVVPSLDACSERLFRRINRPCREITAQGVIEGLLSFGERFRGEIHLEVLLVDGLNTDPSELEKIRSIADTIDARKIQLNTATRPPCETDVLPVTADKMEELLPLLGEKAEIIGSAAARPTPGELGEEGILQVLGRRPCTTVELSEAVRLHPAEVVKVLARLEKSGVVNRMERHREVYYTLAPESREAGG